MKTRSTATLCILLFAAMQSPVHAGDEVELVRLMGNMQYMAHKTALAIDARNQPLATLYLHEIEEVIEKLEQVESFDGHPIGSLVKSLLVPSFETLEDRVKSGDWNRASAQFDRLVDSCNSCHGTTDHGYIHIQRSTANPFMQSFQPR